MVVRNDDYVTRNFVPGSTVTILDVPMARCPACSEYGVHFVELNALADLLSTATGPEISVRYGPRGWMFAERRRVESGSERPPEPCGAAVDAPHAAESEAAGPIRS
jgi:hypothetical protein